MHDYTTVKEPYTSSFIERKSEFITDIAPADSPEAAAAFVAQIKGLHKKASHVVYAYIVESCESVPLSADGDIGTNKTPSHAEKTAPKCTETAPTIYTKFSDDGEPAGTAGKPVFDVLFANGFTNTVITVTRYFGGILLGGGGLTRAYAKAAANGCKDVSRRILRVCVPVLISMPYNLYGKVASILIERPNIIRADQPVFSDRVEINARILCSSCGEVLKKITDVTNGEAVFVEYDKIHADFA
jgi:putative IMPACT (imprinted ancient) family translation regulator